MKWFKHEAEAHSNIKLQSLIDKVGVSGYGYYWACVELVASQGENFRLKRDKMWQLHLKKMLNIEPNDQKRYLVVLANHNLIDRIALKIGDLYIPKLEERCDEYTDKVNRKSRQGRESVGLEQNKTEQNTKEKKVTAHIDYLKKIPEEDLGEFYKRFDCSKKAIQSKAEDLYSWCETNGRVKKNYKTFLLVALKKDFSERKEPKSVFEAGCKVVYAKEEEKERKPIPQDIKDSISKIIGDKQIKQ